MKCIVIEDDKIACKILLQMIQKTKVLTLLDSFSDPFTALAFLKDNPVDLIFLDIEMPEMTGIELLKNLHPEPLIIFTTGKPEYAIEAFHYNAVDYLLKPIDFPRFLKAVIKAEEWFEIKQSGIEGKIEVDNTKSKLDFIFVKSDSVNVKLTLKDLVYVEALGDYINVFTKNKKYTVHQTMKSIENILPSNFIRVHRSFIVNTSFIDSIEDSTISIASNLIPIGVSYRPEVYKKLNL